MFQPRRFVKLVQINLLGLYLKLFFIREDLEGVEEGRLEVAWSSTPRQTNVADNPRDGMTGIFDTSKLSYLFFLMFSLYSASAGTKCNGLNILRLGWRLGPISR